MYSTLCQLLTVNLQEHQLTLQSRLVPREQHCRTQLITQLNALVLAVAMTTSHSYLL